jgi:hypothetical protein
MDVLAHWSANPVVLAAVGAVAAVHLAGRPRPVARAAAFYGGLLGVVIALVSPVAYEAGRFIWVRSFADVLRHRGDSAVRPVAGCGGVAGPEHGIRPAARAAGVGLAVAARLQIMVIGGRRLECPQR